MSQSNWLASFIRAWDILLDYSLPLQTEESEEDISILYFPIVGAVLGVILYVVAKLLMLFLGTLGAAVVVGVVAPFVYEIITSSRALKSLALLFYFKRSRIPMEQAIPQLGEEFRLTDELFSLMFVFSTLLLRMAIVGVLIYKGAVFWLSITLIVSYAIQGYFALINNFTTGRPVLEDNEANLKPMLLFTLGLSALFSLGSGLFITAIVLTLTFFLCNNYSKKMIINYNGVSPELIGVISYIAQLFYLIIGLAIFARG